LHVTFSTTFSPFCVLLVFAVTLLVVAFVFELTAVAFVVFVVAVVAGVVAVVAGVAVAGVAGAIVYNNLLLKGYLQNTPLSVINNEF